MLFLYLYRMKVLVATTTFPRWKNDTRPSFVYSLSGLLARKFKIYILAPHHHGAKLMEKMGNLTVYRFPYFYPRKYQHLAWGAGILSNIKRSNLAKLQLPSFLLSELVYLNKLIKKEKIGLIHAHWIIPSGLLAVILKKMHNIPVIVSVHGSDIFSLKGPISRLIQRYVIENCDVCTANSSATKEEIIKELKIKKDIKVIPMGVDMKQFARKKDKKLLNKYKNNKNNKILLFVGRLAEQKGLQYLIKALPLVLKKYPKTKLLIIGEGSYKKELTELTDKLNLRENIIFIGALPHAELAGYYKIADAFILPSISGEGLGIVLAEAIAAGAPVIGTKTGGIPDIIKDRETGLLVRKKDEKDIANKISALLGNKKLSAALVKNGQKHIRKNLSWGVIVKKFEKIYSDFKRKNEKN